MVVSWYELSCRLDHVFYHVENSFWTRGLMYVAFEWAVIKWFYSL